MNLKAMQFQTHNDLVTFANTTGNVTTVVAITFDSSSGMFTLFYK